MLEGSHPHRRERTTHPRPAAHVFGQLKARAAALLPALALLFGCDLGEAAHDPASGPPLHVIATYPADGQGTECAPNSPPECGVPVNTTIELRLDRFLDPRTAVRQAIRLDAPELEGHPGLFEPEYDLVERVLVFRFREGLELQPRTLYRIEIAIPPEEEGDGLRAFDGARLEPGEVPLQFSFMTGEAREPARQVPNIRTCDDVVENIFQGAGCSAATCHSPDDLGSGRMGLDLRSQRGLMLTAIDRIAHQTDLGPTSGIGLDNPPRFGTNMLRIARNEPQNSYLLYKLLSDRQNYRPFIDDESDPCEPDNNARHEVPMPEGTCFASSQDEIDRLREWFVRGDSMPIRLPTPPQDLIADGLTRNRLRDLQAWIRAGAPCL